MPHSSRLRREAGGQGWVSDEMRNPTMVNDEKTMSRRKLYAESKSPDIKLVK